MRTEGNHEEKKKEKIVDGRNAEWEERSNKVFYILEVDTSEDIEFTSKGIEVPSKRKFEKRTMVS